MRVPVVSFCILTSLSKGIEEMKALVRTNHNKAEEAITRAKEELALAKLIRHGADRDLMHA